MTELTEAGIAEALLLAMDGDFLPGAGMGCDNAGQDVPIDRARPKEIAHWAAGVIAELEAGKDAWRRPNLRGEGDSERMPWPLANIIHRPDVAHWLTEHDRSIRSDAWRDGLVSAGAPSGSVTYPPSPDNPFA